MTATRAATLAVNEATYVAWNAHDADAVAAVFADDAVLREAGIPPTGRAVRLQGATFTRLGPDGLVVEDVHFTDMAGLLAQLGLA